MKKEIDSFLFFYSSFVHFVKIGFQNFVHELHEIRKQGKTKANPDVATTLLLIISRTRQLRLITHPLLGSFKCFLSSSENYR